VSEAGGRKTATSALESRWKLRHRWFLETPSTESSAGHWIQSRLDVHYHSL